MIALNMDMANFLQDGTDSWGMSREQAKPRDNPTGH